MNPTIQSRKLDVPAVAAPGGGVACALTRAPSANLSDCELSFLDRHPIDIARAQAQHAAYQAALTAAGLEVILLPALDHLPDAVFVEDTAVVVDELAVLAPLGIPSRCPELEPMAEALACYRPMHRLSAAATLDGGDVLRIGRTLYVGRSARTNEAAITELRCILNGLGYRVVAVPVHGCLHLKTGCTYVGQRIVLINCGWVDPAPFEADGLRLVSVDPAEPWAANTLLIQDTLLVAAGNPATCATLQRLGLRSHAVDISEFQKAEAGVTCLSVIIDRPAGC